MLICRGIVILIARIYPTLCVECYYFLFSFLFIFFLSPFLFFFFWFVFHLEWLCTIHIFLFILHTISQLKKSKNWRKPKDPFGIAVISASFKSFEWMTLTDANIYLESWSLETTFWMLNINNDDLWSRKWQNSNYFLFFLFIVRLSVSLFYFSFCRLLVLYLALFYAIEW